MRRRGTDSFLLILHVLSFLVKSYYYTPAATCASFIKVTYCQRRVLRKYCFFPPLPTYYRKVMSKIYLCPDNSTANIIHCKKCVLRKNKYCSFLPLPTMQRQCQILLNFVSTALCKIYIAKNMYLEKMYIAPF